MGAEHDEELRAVLEAVDRAAGFVPFGEFAPWEFGGGLMDVAEERDSGWSWGDAAAVGVVFVGGVGG